MRSLIRLQVCFSLALIGLLCAAGFSAPKAKAPTGAPYVIGAIFAVTGDASSLGIPERDTAMMLEKMINSTGGINGRPLKIIIEDTKSEPAEAVNAAKRLIERDKVLAIVGPTRTGEALAVSNVAEKARVPLVACAAGIEIVEPVKAWVFKTPQSDRMAVAAIINYLRAKRITRVATISDNTGFGKGGMKEINKLFPAAKIQVVDSEEYGPKDSSMMPQLIKIKGRQPQAVICWGTPPGPATISKEMRSLAMKMPLICSHGVANATFINNAQGAANGVVLPAGRLLVVDQTPANHRQKPVLTTYAKGYQANFRKPADTFGGHSWDAIQLVANALRKVGPDRAKLRAELEKTRGFVGTAGTFNFSPKDHNGLGPDAFVMVQVVNGQWRLIK